MSEIRHSKIKTRSVCFISNRTVSTEAELFTAAICKRQIFNTFCLITRCATKADMIVFNEWRQRKRPIYLVLPASYPENLTSGQKRTIEILSAASGETIPCHQTETGECDELLTQIQMADFIIVMEIGSDHPILDRHRYQLDPKNTAVFQWAVSTKYNQGCRLLVSSGRGTPVYPAYRDYQLDAFLNGQPSTCVEFRQPDLGLV